MKSFANTNRGRQIDFLLHGERTNYKLADSPFDLTFAQIYFEFYCQKLYNDEVESLQNEANGNELATPLSITSSDSREEIIEKANLIRRNVYG